MREHERFEDHYPLADWAAAGPLTPDQARQYDAVVVMVNAFAVLPQGPAPLRAPTRDGIARQLRERRRISAEASGSYGVGIYHGILAADVADAYCDGVTLAAAPPNAPLDTVWLTVPSDPLALPIDPRLRSSRIDGMALLLAGMRYLEPRIAALTTPEALDVVADAVDPRLGEGRVRLHGSLISHDGMLVCERGHDDGAIHEPVTWLVLQWERDGIVTCAKRLSERQIRMLGRPSSLAQALARSSSTCRGERQERRST